MVSSIEKLQNLNLEDGTTYVSSKIRFAKKTSAVWEIELEDDYSTCGNYDTSRLSFEMDIGGDRKLHFYLWRHSYNFWIGVRFSGDTFRSFRGKAGFLLEIDSLDKTGGKKTALYNQRVELNIQSHLEKTYGIVNIDMRSDSDVHNLSDCPTKKHYILLLTATCSDSITESDSKDVAKKTLESHFLEQMKDGFYGTNKYPDVTLISSDLMEHGAHKFMLAARSTILAKIIDEQGAKEGFTGRIQLDIGAKPLVTILHWIYTGELHEKAGKCIKDVVTAAVKYELSALLKILDKELITICQKENMAVVFSLYEVANEYEMKTAKDEIAKFIRENL